MLSVIRPPPDVNAAKMFNPMPEEDRLLIVAFLAGEAAEDSNPRHDAAGALLVRRRCTACHLFHGQTDDDESKGPELAGWGSSAWTRAQIANPSSNATYRKYALDPDNKGHMPRFDDKLEADDIHLLADWVRKTARGGK
jgi:mono/diheme cytochrome c family protein